ncbi:hybrid sensor histidine kinase/response regulator transcription factor [Confluentibacter sediminis]|uniref:hybrid sensor histidine kinase/response regulator transcription factor n=1 Tax=Confluentibacter sediminis TaxID=2219045 RepID=UPI000DAC5C1E|nr:two-component regulator propeller domain-containing protein [Confluentibacter sediminis]
MLFSLKFKAKFFVSVSICVMSIYALKAFGQSQHTSFIPIQPDILSNSHITCSFKDSKGYMWFGTYEGLIRYDGTNIYRYQNNPKDSTSIRHNNINVIVEDAESNLWVGTARGLCKFDREKDNFIFLNSIPNIKGWLYNGYVTSLLFDDYGNLWIGTHGGGVFVYNHKSLELKNISGNNFYDSKEKFVTALLCIDDKILCGTKGGLKVFDANKKTLIDSGFIKGVVIDNQVTALAKDREKKIWISTLNGALIKGVKIKNHYVLETKISGKTDIEGSNSIWSICSDRKGNIWMGGENSGLTYLNVENNKIVHFGPESKVLKKLPTASISSIFIDDLEHVWIGTFNHGAFIIDNSPSKFGRYNWGNINSNDIIGREITSFAQQENGDVWLASNKVGLIKIDLKTNELKYCKAINIKLASSKITSLVFDTSKNLWIGTGEGLFKFNLNTNSLKKYNLISEGLGDNNPSVLFEDKKHRLWAGTSGSGLFYLDSETDTFISLNETKQPNSISNILYVSSLAEDKNGSLWVGTFYGLYQLTEIGHYSFKYNRFYANELDPKSLASSSIQSLVLDAEDNLWIGTTDNGLNLKEKGSNSFKAFKEKDGLASNVVRGLTIDNSGNLWVSGNAGLTKINLQTKSFSKYSKSDGLMSNGFLPNASFTTNQGKLFFGSNKGMNAFYADSIDIQLPLPKFYFTGLKINNQLVTPNELNSPLIKPIEYTSNIELSYKQRSFTLDFAAINFDPSFKYDYCYMLQGFDTEWNCIGANTSATYTNIDPGNYVFMVKALGRGKPLDIDPLKLNITIQQIIWLTWWAKLLYVLLISLVVFFLVKIRLDRIKIRNQLVLEKLAREKEHELLESKTAFFTNISHEFRTPLSLISMPLEKIMDMEGLPKSVKKGLNVIKVNSNRMFRLVNELMDFSKMENAKLELGVQEGELVGFIKGIASSFYDLAAKKNISFEIDVAEPKLIGWFDHDKLEKILINILSNAFKFTSKDGHIRLIVQSRLNHNTDKITKTRFIEIQIIDNGIGIPQNELPFIFDKFYQVRSPEKIINSGTGIGLSLTKGLVELHHGNIEVESISGEVTKFLILIPIDKHIYSEDELMETSIHLNIQEEIKGYYDYESFGDDEEEDHDTKKTDKIDGTCSTILIVEDNDDLREYLSVELGRQFIIIEAENGQQGFDIAAEIGPDLIISDIAMPIKSGLELCREVKTNMKTSHIPFILLTAKASLDHQVLGIENGADIYITKPFSIRFLVAQVNQVIESRKRLYAQFSQNVYLMPGMVTKNEMDKEFLQKIISYIIENIQDPELGVSQLAEIFNLSHKQVYRKIKALTGKSVVNFIRVIRIKESLKLMETQKYTLKEVAYMTGFNSASYFTTSFKEEYGKAPSEFLDQIVN